ncbi:MAG: ComEC/Rec2 family competence protein [Bacteroides sp.]|nr:ComEC/Rec2 family competence protein [Bacteroides sp.]
MNPNFKIPLLSPLAGVIAGILAVSYFAFPLTGGVAALLIIATGFVALRFARGAMRMRRFSVSKYWRLSSGFILFFGLGVLTASFQLRENRFDHPRFDAFCASLPQQSRLRLYLERKNTTQYGDNWDCRLAGVILQDSTTGRVLESQTGFEGQPMRVRFGATPFRPGDRVSVPARIIAENRSVRNRDWTIDGKKRGLVEMGRELQKRICILIEKSGLNRKTTGFVCALLAGEQGMLDRRDRNTLSDAGLAHILAVSGMHVGVIGGLLYMLLLPFNIAGKWRLRRLAVIPVIWFFALSSGFAPSVVRASVMLSIAFVCLVIEKDRVSLNALGFAAILILLFDPSALWHIGFQLSFVCVAAILLFVEPLNPIDRERHPRIRKGMALMLVPVVASLSTWVLTAYYFGRVPLAFLPLNLIVVPLLPFYMGVSLFHLGLCAAGFPTRMTGRILECGYGLLTDGASLVGGDGATVWQLETDLSWVFLWFLFMGATAWFLHSRNARKRRPADGAF